MKSAWRGRLGTMERTSVLSSRLYTSPSALSTAAVNNMASTVVDSFDEPGMARHLHQYKIIFLLPLRSTFILGRCSTMYTSPCSSVGHSLPDSPCLLFDITLHSSQPSSPRHSSLPPPLYLHFHRPSSYVVLFPSHHMPLLTSSASSLELLFDFSHFRCLPYSLIPYPIELCNRSYHCPVQLPLRFSRSFLVTQHSPHSLPVLSTVLERHLHQ